MMPDQTRWLARYLIVAGFVTVFLGGYLGLDGMVTDGWLMLVIGFGLGMSTEEEL